MINKKQNLDTDLLCLTYDTFYHAATAWSGGQQDAEGVPGEIPGIRALPRAPHVSDTTSLPSRKSWLNFGGNIEIFFVFFYVECERLPVGYEHFCGLLPSFKC